MPGKAERVIAGRCRHHAGPSLLVGKAKQRVSRAALFKTSGELFEIALAENRHARELAERRGVRARRETQSDGKAPARLLNGFEGKELS